MATVVRDGRKFRLIDTGGLGLMAGEKKGGEVWDAAIAEQVEAAVSAADAVIDSRAELTNAIFKVNQAIDSFRMLIDYLESDPGALLRGKERPDK